MVLQMAVEIKPRRCRTYGIIGVDIFVSLGYAVTGIRYQGLCLAVANRISSDACF